MYQDRFPELFRRSGLSILVILSAASRDRLRLHGETDFDSQWRERFFLPVDGDLTLNEDEATGGVGLDMEFQAIGSVVLLHEFQLAYVIRRIGGQQPQFHFGLGRGKAE